MHACYIAGNSIMILYRKIKKHLKDYIIERNFVI